MNNSKGNLIFLTVICVATLLVAVIGATFAYFNISMTKDSDTTIEVTNGTIATEYQDNSKIRFETVEPGSLIMSKTFTINGLITGSSNLAYEIDLSINENTYLDNEIVYSISSTNDSSNGSIIPTSEERVTLPTGSNIAIIGKGLFAGPIQNGAIHTYTINIYAQDTIANANGKVFDANIRVVQSTK